MDKTIWSAPTLLMVVGGIVFVIAFLGCCGAVRESSCMVLSVSIDQNQSDNASKDKMTKKILSTVFSLSHFNIFV